jgi:hypothetical protein
VIVSLDVRSHTTILAGIKGGELHGFFLL